MFIQRTQTDSVNNSFEACLHLSIIQYRIYLHYLTCNPMNTMPTDFCSCIQIPLQTIFNDFYFFHYSWLTVFCQFSTVQESDPMTHTCIHSFSHVILHCAPS